MVMFTEMENMDEYLSNFSKGPADKKTMLVTYAHYEAKFKLDLLTAK